jgi:HEPN domain-containing protein
MRVEPAVPERSRDWFRQAQYDLEKAQLDLQWQYFEWACFTAHQAAEKAVKAVYYAHHGEARGHGVRELLASLGLAVSDAVFEQATFLDRFYIPTRYPNGLPAGVPHDYFSREDAAQAIAAAEAIHVWCQSHLPGA